MFNWFKKKIELKNENCIMSSVCERRGTKLGSEVVVPNDFECLIYCKNKYYQTLSPGKYKIEKSLFPKLFTNNKKKTSKRIKIVLHYVNKSNHKLEIIVKKIKYEIDFVIEDCIKFCTLMLLYNYKVDNDYVKSYLSEIFEELIKANHYNIGEIPQTALFDYGIKIIDLSNNNKKSSIFNSSANKTGDSQPRDTITPLDKENETNSINETISKEEPVSSNNIKCCPKCKYPIKFDTKYCLRCGHQLTD